MDIFQNQPAAALLKESQYGAKVHPSIGHVSGFQPTVPAPRLGRRVERDDWEVVRVLHCADKLLKRTDCAEVGDHG